jgi:hypothetical protein
MQTGEVLAKLLKTRKKVIPGKRRGIQNPVPLGAGFMQFWIPAPAPDLIRGLPE